MSNRQGTADGSEELMQQAYANVSPHDCAEYRVQL